VHQEAAEKAEEETVDDASTVKQDSDDEDFMKPASDSDEDSDSDGDGGSTSTKKKSKKKKKGKGRLNRKSSKLDPDELMNEESAELNEADAKNDVYATFAMGLVLELFVYLPASSVYQGMEMPSGTWKMKFTVDDLDPLFYMREEKERVARALRAVYYKFFESATAEEVRLAEQDWDWLAHVLVKRSRWVVRGGRSSAVVTTASEVQNGIRKLDAAQDVLTDEERLVYIQSLLFSDAEPMRSASAQEKSMFSDGPSMKFISSQSSFKLPSGLISAGSEEVPEVELVTEDPPPFVTLTWPSTVWTMAMKIRSTVESRGESVRMQVPTVGMKLTAIEHSATLWELHPLLYLVPHTFSTHLMSVSRSRCSRRARAWGSSAWTASVAACTLRSTRTARCSLTRYRVSASSLNTSARCRSSSSLPPRCLTRKLPTRLDGIHAFPCANSRSSGRPGIVISCYVRPFDAKLRR
jgi:hypothetical protein